MADKGISAIDLAIALDGNYKTALFLTRNCRFLMADSSSAKMLDSKFYESDMAYIGTKNGNRNGLSIEKQPCIWNPIEFYTRMEKQRMQ